MAGRKPVGELSEFAKNNIDTILKIMELQNITPRMICFDLGLDEGQFSKFAKKKYNFSIDKICLILEYLGYGFRIVPIEELEY